MTIYETILINVLIRIGIVDSFVDAILSKSMNFRNLDGDSAKILDFVERIMKAICRGLYRDHLLILGHDDADVWAAINSVPLERQRTLSYLKKYTITAKDCISLLNRAQIAIAEMTIWEKDLSEDWENDPLLKSFSYVGERYAIGLYKSFLAPLLAFLGISISDDAILEEYRIYALGGMIDNEPFYCLESFTQDAEGIIHDIHRFHDVSDEVADIVRRLNAENVKKIKERSWKYF